MRLRAEVEKDSGGIQEFIHYSSYDKANYFLTSIKDNYARGRKILKEEKL